MIFAILGFGFGVFENMQFPRRSHIACSCLSSLTKVLAAFSTFGLNANNSFSSGISSRNDSQSEKNGLKNRLSCPFIWPNSSDRFPAWIKTIEILLHTFFLLLHKQYGSEIYLKDIKFQGTIPFYALACPSVLGCWFPAWQILPHRHFQDARECCWHCISQPWVNDWKELKEEILNWHII